MKNLIILSVVLFSIFSSFTVLAQDSHKGGHNVSIKIPNVALVDVESEGGSTITLQPQAPKEAGEFLDFSNAEDKSLWLNISSVIGKRGNRRITAAITNGKVPAGLQLQAQAFRANHKGKGHLGNGTSKITLTGTPTDIIKNVGTGYSEDGVRRGYNLWYGLKIKSENDIHKINFDNSNTLTITYTITDN